MKLLQITKPISIFIIIISASILLRAIFIFQPALSWWDSAMYIGIGKYIYTNGQLGVFEIFRPFLWPIIQGGFWKIGIDPNIAGKIIAMIASVGILALVYNIGESIKKYAGVFAMFLLATVPVFFQFSIIQITDIPSAFCSLLAVWLILNKKYFLAGLAVSISFALRFPQALFVFPILLFIFIQALETKAWREFFKQSLKFILGASSVIVPYLIFSQIAYGDALLPIKLGSQVVDSVNEPTSFDYLYYIKKLAQQNPFFIFSYIVVLATPFYRKLKIRKEIILLSLCLVIVGGYFSQVTHKEPRYMLGFIAYAALLSGYALALILEKIPKKLVATILLIGGSIIILVVTYGFYAFNFVTPAAPFADLSRLEHFFDNYPNSRVITNYPMIVGLSDIKIPMIIDSWESASAAYSQQKDSMDYLMINSCFMSCPNTIAKCDEARKTLLSELESKEQTVLATTTAITNCQLLVFKMKN